MVRDGIVLATGFTATVNVSLSVGALTETITVTGASPVVDTQSMRRQETLNTKELDALPSGNIGLQTLAYVTPGFAATQADVGGTRDTWSAQGNYTFYHGKTGTRANFDGFRNQYFVERGVGRRLHHRPAATSRNCSSKRAAWARSRGRAARR